MLIFGGYLKVRRSLYILFIIWVTTILIHIDARVILLRYEGSCLVYSPNVIETKMASNTHTLFVSKNVKFSLWVTKRYQKKMILDQHWFGPCLCTWCHIRAQERQVSPTRQSLILYAYNKTY